MRIPVLQVPLDPSSVIGSGECENTHVRVALVQEGSTARVTVTELSGLRWWPEALAVNTTEGSSESLSGQGWTKLQPHGTVHLDYPDAGPNNRTWTSYHLVYINNNGPRLGGRRIMCPLDSGTGAVTP